MDLLSTLNVELNLSETEWMVDGECNKYSPDLHHPDGETSAKAREQIRQAKAVCAVCPFETECLEWAVSHGEYFGVWGGQSEGERKATRLDQAAPVITQSREPVSV